jgi:hypothetical protein
MAPSTEEVMVAVSVVAAVKWPSTASRESFDVATVTEFFFTCSQMKM